MLGCILLVLGFLSLTYTYWMLKRDSKRLLNNVNIEIERKWILRNLPDEARNEDIHSIEQWYDENDEGVLRYRAKTDINSGANTYEKIIKKHIAKGTNTEQRLPVDQEKFWNELHNGMRYIAKTRYTTTIGKKFEIDVFQDFSLIVLEVELNDLHEPITFPAWLEREIIAEVTGMDEFSNYNMAKVEQLY